MRCFYLGYNFSSYSLSCNVLLLKYTQKPLRLTELQQVVSHVMLTEANRNKMYFTSIAAHLIVLLLLVWFL